MYSEEIMFHAKKLYDYHNVNRKNNHSDFILAMGSHDLRTAYKASELYKEGKANFIICAGGYGKITKEIWKVPEAEKFATICIAEGVPEDKILIEDQSSNSGDNFIFSKKLLEEQGFTVKTGLIVCKNYLSRRALNTAKKQWSEIDWYIETPEIDFEQYPNDEVPLERMIHLMVGDIERLQVYGKKDFQLPVTVPSDILESYEYLKKAGFNKYLL